MVRKLYTPYSPCNRQCQEKQSNSHLLLQRKKNKQTKKKHTSANLQLLELPLSIPFEETSEQACHVK